MSGQRGAGIDQPDDGIGGRGRVGHRPGGGLQQRLNLARCEVRRLLQEQRHHAADVRGGQGAAGNQGVTAVGNGGDHFDAGCRRHEARTPPAGSLDAAVRVAGHHRNHRFERGGKTGFVTAFQGRGHHDHAALLGGD